MERPERHIDLFDYLNKAGPIKEPVVRDVFIQVRKKHTYTASRNTKAPIVTRGCALNSENQELMSKFRFWMQLSTATIMGCYIEI